MVVYLVLSDDGASTIVEGVFSTDEGARAFVDGPGRYIRNPVVEAYGVDARVSLTERMARGERLWQAVLYKPGRGGDFTEEQRRGPFAGGAEERATLPAYPHNGYIAVTRWGATDAEARQAAEMYRDQLIAEGVWK